MSYHRFISEAWLMLPTAMAGFQTVFKYEVPAKAKAGRNFLGDPIPETSYTDNGVAVVPLYGPLIHKAGYIEKGFGATATDEFAQTILDEASKKPRAIVLDIHSPGGTVSGTAEAAAAVRQASRMVPVHAFTDSMTASAAYWIGSQAGAGFYATQGAQVGSIGAMLETLSFARLLNQAGIDPSVITSAELKPTGHPYLPLSDEGREYLQSHINTAGDMFKAAVRSARPGVSAQALDGRMFFAPDAKRFGLIDRIVGGIQDVIDMAGGSAGALSKSSGKGPVTPSARAECPKWAREAMDFVRVLNSNSFNGSTSIPSMNAKPEKEPSQLDNLLAAGKFEAAYNLLPLAERAQFLGAKSYAAYMKASRKGQVKVSTR